MPSFTNLNDVQKYLQDVFADVMNTSADVERVLESTMRNAVIEHVYGAYEPQFYERRGDDGGLSDVDNYAITDVSIVGNKVRVLYENLTTGADNLSGEYIGDLIEFGGVHAGKQWSVQGVWSEPRPFSAKATEHLQESGELEGAIREALGSRGFTVRK